jgi:hypothetical protein
MWAADPGSEEEIMTTSRLVLAVLLSLIIGFGLGLLAHRIIAPTGRFVTNDMTGNDVALDSKTGQYCYSLPDQQKDMPYCLDLYRKY